MTAYKRAEQLRNTLVSIRKQTVESHQVILVEDGINFDSYKTKKYCDEFGAEYYQRRDRFSDDYACSSIPINIGIKKARGEILVLQCSECMYDTVDGLEKLVAPVKQDRFVTTVPRVLCLNQDGSPNVWFIHPTENPRFLNFCQAVRLEHVLKIGGFDERYKGFGWEDIDFEERLKARGVMQRRVDTLVSHQWHSYAAGSSTEWYNKNLFEETRIRIQCGEMPVANEGKSWGLLNG